MFADLQPLENYYLTSVDSAIKPTLSCIYSRTYSGISFLASLQKRAEPLSLSILELMPFEDQWTKYIKKRNKKDSGILLISPPKSLHNPHSLIDDAKNVEGNDTDDRLHRVSCTARAIIASIAFIRSKGILDRSINHFKEYIQYSNIVIIGYGKAVGKPLTYLLMRYHAGSVSIIHKYTHFQYAERQIQDADIIVSATGIADILRSYCSPQKLKDKIIIDAGICNKDGRIVGDIHPDFAENNIITKVPGGIGRMTTAMIIDNTYLACEGKL